MAAWANTGSETRAAREHVGDAQVAGAIDRVQADEVRARGRKDAALLDLGVLARREPGHALQAHARAVDRRADLRRAIERAALGEKISRGPRAANVGLHGVARMRRPRPEQ